MKIGRDKAGEFLSLQMDAFMKGFGKTIQCQDMEGSLKRTATMKVR